jgi:hypothetical protein
MDPIATHRRAEPRGAKPSFAKDDLWTVAAFGVLAYMISNVLHEGLGHGVAAWFSGAHRITVTSTYMDAGLDTGWILAAGTLVNLAFGVLGLRVSRGIRCTGMPLRLFVWALTAFNLLLGTGYFLFSGISGIGDWAEWMKGLPLVSAWRVGFGLLGGVSYGTSAWLLARELTEIIGPDQRRMRRMTWTMYFAGGLTACAAGVWNPMGWRLVLISAAASSFGGASGLLWIPSIAYRWDKDTVAVTKMIGKLRWLWMATLLLLAGFIWFLGRGVTLAVRSGE